MFGVRLVASARIVDRWLYSVDSVVVGWRHCRSVTHCRCIACRQMQAIIISVSSTQFNIGGRYRIVRYYDDRALSLEGQPPKAGGWPSDRMLAVQLKARVIELTAS